MTENTDSERAKRAIRGVLWPGFVGRGLPHWVRNELESGLAGVVYFAQNLDDAHPGQAAELSDEIRDANPLALIGVDEEGGNVTRLEARLGSTLPGAAQLGHGDDEAATAVVGRELAYRAAEAGISVLLAPAADVNTNPLNPVIGVRSFGSDPELVSRHAHVMCRAIQETPVFAGTRGADSVRTAAPHTSVHNVAACAKHYPGHGDTHLDSHHALPTAEGGWEQLQAGHGAPFDAVISAGVKLIMTAHIRVPDRGPLPATLNPRILGTLRELGFTGVVVTDALDMAAIAREYGSGRGAVLALLAGADLLCIGNPANPAQPGRDGAGDGQESDDDTDARAYREVFDAVEAAVHSGELPLEVVSRAAERVRELARWTMDGAGNGAAQTSAAPAGSERLSAEHAEQITRSGFTVHGQVTPLMGRIAVLDLRARVNWAVATTTDALTQALREMSGDEAAYRMRPTSESDVRTTLGHIPASDALVVLVDRVAAPGSQRRWLEEARLHGRTFTVINVGLPCADLGAGQGPPMARIDTRADSRVSARVVARMLRFGEPAP